MDGGAQKLRSLARQTRTFSVVVTDAERANALQALARLYENQAMDLRRVSWRCCSAQYGPLISIVIGRASSQAINSSGVENRRLQPALEAQQSRSR